MRIVVKREPKIGSNDFAVYTGGTLTYRGWTSDALWLVRTWLRDYILDGTR